MEYYSITREEALVRQKSDEKLKGRTYTDKESGLKFIVIDVFVLPSEAPVILAMTNKIAQAYAGAQNKSEIENIARNYTKDKFTVALFGKTTELPMPRTQFSPLTHSVNHTGELVVDYGVEFDEV